MQRDHFCKRMSERFNIRVTNNDLEILKKQIINGKSIFIEKDSNRTSIHGVKLNEIWLVVIYDKNRNELVTVLPKTDKKYNCLKDSKYVKKV